MEKEIILDEDRFANYKSNLYSCPRCNAEFLQYVGQSDDHYCLNDGCGWVESGYFGGGPEDIDYDNPVRQRLIPEERAVDRPKIDAAGTWPGIFGPGGIGSGVAGA